MKPRFRKVALKTGPITRDQRRTVVPMLPPSFGKVGRSVQSPWGLKSDRGSGSRPPRAGHLPLSGPGQVSNHGHQLFGLHGFGEVRLEPRRQGVPAVLVPRVSRQREGRDLPARLGPERPHLLEVDGFVWIGVDCFLSPVRFRSPRGMPATFEQECGLIFPGSLRHSLSAHTVAGAGVATL
jgi:hypothetical protein